MNPQATLTEWLRRDASRDALLSAWSSGTTTTTTACQTEALALVARALKQERNIAIGHPGGRSRLPLLAAVHLAALQLDGYPSPFAPRRRGPVVFATRQLIRRDELLDIDAAHTPICPALRIVRMRADGTVVPLHSGRPRSLTPDNKLIVVNTPPEGFTAAAAIVVDGITEDAAFTESAIEWAARAKVPMCTFEDSARRRWPADFLLYSSGWAEIARHAEPESHAYVAAARRGHAAAIDAGPQPGLARAAHLLADARGRRHRWPAQLIEASTLWRRLDELVMPISDYDAACPRWRTPTLSERVQDLSEWSSSTFPDGWRTWAQTCWAGVKEGILDAYDHLSQGSPKASLLAQLVDRQLSAGNSVDIALPSRTARDGALRYLAGAGVLIPTDGSLNLRSLKDPENPRLGMPTLLAAPPGAVLRHRLTGADTGAINVLCYEHETRTLQRTLADNLAELLTPSAAICELAPRNLTLRIDGPQTSPPVVVEMVRPTATHTPGSAPTRLVDFATSADQTILNALQAFNGPSDLPDDVGAGDTDSTMAVGGAPHAFVPMTVTPNSGAAPFTLNVAVSQRVMRIVAGTATRIGALDVRPSMLVADLAGPSTFDRLRALLMQTHGPLTRMFVAAWDHALSIALTRCGSHRALAQALSRSGSGVGVHAVAEWADQDRIGPADPHDVARIGRLAEHRVVADNAPAIAEAMQQLRLLHQRVGRAVVASVGGDAGGLDELETLLGPDALTIVHETVIYRVLHVGELVSTNGNPDSRPDGENGDNT